MDEPNQMHHENLGQLVLYQRKIDIMNKVIQEQRDKILGYSKIAQQYETQTKDVDAMKDRIKRLNNDTLQLAKFTDKVEELQKELESKQKEVDCLKSELKVAELTEQDTASKLVEISIKRSKIIGFQIQNANAVKSHLAIQNSQCSIVDTIAEVEKIYDANAPRTLVCNECCRIAKVGQAVSKKPLSVEVLANTVKIIWPKDALLPLAQEHTSEYDKKWLQRFHYTKPFQPTIKPVMWDLKNYKRESIDYKDFQTPDGFKKVLRQLHDYGLSFLKNVPTDKDTRVEQVAQSFGPIQETFYGKSWDVKNDPNSKNIAYTSLYLGLHMDLMYFESPPGLQFLHCLQNTVTGGTSLFLDLFKVVEDLRREHPKQFKVLTEYPVRFLYENDGHHMDFNRPTINIDINDGYNIYYSPPFQGPLHGPPEKVDEFYEAFALLETKINQRDGLYEYLMKEGDLVIFANRRVLHGRDKFDPFSGHRWLKGTYIGFDEFKVTITNLG
ncbi:hypothetical protein HDV01_002833 [Terramyces sp. JEL0728]|nr:hypothetical protein HDV01_002833 [Terramyces sp. JEL0728]